MDIVFGDSGAGMSYPSFAPVPISSCVEFCCLIGSMKVSTTLPGSIPQGTPNTYILHPSIKSSDSYAAH
jgi:hypothetical protein